MIDVGSALKALGAHGSTAAVPVLIGYMVFTPAEQYDRHVAEERTSTVQSLIETLRNEPAGAYRDTLCRTLESTLAQICLDSPEHPFCIDRAVLLAKAGCR